MLCRDAKFLLPDLHLDDLGPEERAALEGHLVACATCRQASEEIGCAVEGLRREAKAERLRPVPPTDVGGIVPARRVRARLERALRPLTRVAALLLAALGTASLFGMEVKAGDGALAIRFALPGTRPDPDPVVPVYDFAELVGEAVRREVAATLAPAFRDLFFWMSTAEDRRVRDLSVIAEWADDRRRRDAALFADALTSTRADLDLTRTAVFEVAGQTLRRQEW